MINALAYSATVLIYDCKEFIAEGPRFSPIRKKPHQLLRQVHRHKVIALLS
jgi:hypothetical protein